MSYVLAIVPLMPFKLGWHHSTWLGIACTLLIYESILGLGYPAECCCEQERLKRAG